MSTDYPECLAKEIYEKLCEITGFERDGDLDWLIAQCNKAVDFEVFYDFDFGYTLFTDVDEINEEALSESDSKMIKIVVDEGNICLTRWNC